jgi:hypothetical protein
MAALCDEQLAICDMRHGEARREFERRRPQRLIVLPPSVPAKQTDRRIE